MAYGNFLLTGRLHIRIPNLRVANVQRSRLDLGEIKMIDVPDKGMPKYQLQDGDVLLCKGNSAKLVGRGTVWRNEIPNCVHQNYVLRARMDTSKILLKFVFSVINLAYGKPIFGPRLYARPILPQSTAKRLQPFLCCSPL